VYSVSVSASAVRAKVSLGTNPWNQATANQNLASLAEKYGGGGHARVSAISFDPGSLTRHAKSRAILRPSCAGNSPESCDLRFLDASTNSPLPCKLLAISSWAGSSIGRVADS